MGVNDVQGLVLRVAVAARDGVGLRRRHVLDAVLVDRRALEGRFGPSHAAVELDAPAVAFRLPEAACVVPSHNDN